MNKKEVRNRLKDKKGFTLIELLVVMVIIGLIAALVGPNIFKNLGKGQQKAARAQIELLGQVLDSYRLDVGNYPTTSEGLNALITSSGAEGWDGPYLKKTKVPLDPWKHPYHYQSPGTNGDYDLFSYGADNAPGGEGDSKDIASWE
ncbi:MAG: type II secretion system major pseudopilin GspG [Nitrospiraceae bacterium]|nr:MAG: type II secretion system major pseudopilin GspG [Nitrospiraceae bacterium]